MTIQLCDPRTFKKKYYFSVKHHRFQDFRSELLTTFKIAMKYHNAEQRKIKNPKLIESWDEVLDRYLWENMFMRRDNILPIEAFSFNELYGVPDASMDEVVRDRYTWRLSEEDTP